MGKFSRFNLPRSRYPTLLLHTANGKMADDLNAEVKAFIAELTKALSDSDISNPLSCKNISNSEDGAGAAGINEQ